MRLLNPYKIIPNDRGYHFYTDGNLSYFVYFDQGTNYFSKTPNLNPLVFTFGFEAEHDIEEHVSDSRIEDTVISVFLNFFSNNSTSALMYICDAQDSYEKLRFRLFNFWYHRHLQTSCEKLEMKIPELNIYGAVIFRTDNPIAPYLKAAFFQEFD